MRSLALRQAVAVVVSGFLLTVAVRIQAQPSRASAPSILPSDGEIKSILAERVVAIAGNDHRVGIVVGLVAPDGQRVVSYGNFADDLSQSTDTNRVFEIGSLTKIFTALLLSEMVETHEVSLSDPAAKYLPRSIKLPENDGQPITLLQLATHRSGLPFMPEESAPVDHLKASFINSSSTLYGFLAHYQIHRTGEMWDYSNLGYWLLAQALASRAGMSYESLVRMRILRPLGLSNTGFLPSFKMKTHITSGHNATLQPAPAFASVPLYREMNAAGGMLSTVGDLVKVLKAFMGYEPSPLAPAMAAMLSNPRPIGIAGYSQAIGWEVFGQGDDQIVVHDGGTFGFASALSWSPKRRVGVVVLSNQVTGVEDIALHLIQPSFQLSKPASATHTEITVNPALLQSYAGRYEAVDRSMFVVSYEAGLLEIQLPNDWGLPQLRLHAESTHEFFASELPLRVAFRVDDHGHVDSISISPPRGQKAVRAIRLVPTDVDPRGKR